MIQERVEQQSGGRIHRLKLDVAAGRVIEHGCTSAFYLRQLALPAALEVLGSSDPELVDLDIQVVSPAARSDKVV